MEKKKEKNKTKEIKARYKIGFVFGDQDTIESVITFRVDGHTIKRGS